MKLMLFGPLMAFSMLIVVGTDSAIAREAHQNAKAEKIEVLADEHDLHAEEADVEHGRIEDLVETPSASSHSHSDHESNESADAHSESVSLMDWLGRFHPMVIHFPIALFLAAFAAETMFALTGNELFRSALRFTVWGGALSATLAAPLGWMFAAAGGTEEGWILETHRWTGIAAVALGLTILWILERTERQGGSRLLLRVALAIQASLIGTVGFLGGSLIYGFDHLWRGL